MDEHRVEVGVERMGDEKLAKRADAQKVEGTRGRKTKVAMEGLCLEGSGKCGRGMKNNSKR